MKVFWVTVVSSVFRTQNGRTQRSHAVPEHVLIPQDLLDDGAPDRPQQPSRLVWSCSAASS